MKKLTNNQVWKVFFSNIQDKEVLVLLEKLKSSASEVSLDIVKELDSKGISPIQSILFKLTLDERPSLNSFYNEFGFTRDEKVKILEQYVIQGDEDTYPILDLSRQELTFIPQEAPLVNIETIMVADDIAYKEINLAYNAISNLSKEDFEILNHFAGIHLVGLKMETLPAMIKSLTFPIMLNFSFSDLKSLPEEIYELKQLYSLRLNWTGIVNFSEKIANLKNLMDVEMAETPFLDIVYEIEDKDEADYDDVEKEIAGIRAILDELECEIEG